MNPPMDSETSRERASGNTRRIGPSLSLSRFPACSLSFHGKMVVWILLALTLFGLSNAPLRAENLATAFDQANRLYEQGKYAMAATAYEKLLQSEPASPALYFNLGNAWFKAGQSGRAIAAYRQAEMLAPRDPNL